MPPFFPYGTQYHRAPTPLPAEWPGDLARIRAEGYTHVQFRPQWRWHEARRGAPVFDDLDRLFALARENGLRVILKPMLETAPDWVFSELGGTRIGFHGIPITPFAHGAYYVGGWWPCFDNPGVVGAARAFVTALVARYRDEPSLWVYNAWNEPRNRPLGSCQCGHSKALYRAWLRERFGTVEALNDAYGKRWTSLEHVEPPVAAQDYAEMALWRDWAAEAVTGHVRHVIEAIRAADRSRPVMFHRGSVDVLTDIVWDAGDDTRNAALGADWYGLSCGLEFHPATPQQRALAALQCDWTRRVDPGFWCQEFYPRVANWERSPRIGFLAQQALTTLACGAKGFTWWQYRSERVGNEADGFGLTEIDGAPTERSRLAAELAAFAAAHGEEVAASAAPETPVALLYDRDSDMVSRLSICDEILYAGGAEVSKNAPYKAALHGAHALHWMHGVPRDFVRPGDSLAGYRFLHVTATETVTPEKAAWLRAFVEEGGFLFVEFPFACRDANTWVSPERPNCGLAGLLGCREAGRVRIDGRADDRLLWEGLSPLEARGFRVDLEPLGGAVLARWADGKPGAILHRHGRGTVLSSGAGISESSRQGDDPAARAIFLDVLARAGIVPPVPPALAGRLVVQRRRRAGGPDLVFAFNYGSEPLPVPALGAVAATWWGRLGEGNLLGGEETWIGLAAPNPTQS